MYQDIGSLLSFLKRQSITRKKNPTNISISAFRMIANMMLSHLHLKWLEGISITTCIITIVHEAEDDEIDPRNEGI